MSRFAASSERKPSEVPSGAYNGIRSRLEDTGVLGPEGKELIESPVSRAKVQPIPLNIRNGIQSSTVKFEYQLTRLLSALGFRQPPPSARAGKQPRRRF
jgi:hypothetical protein